MSDSFIDQLQPWQWQSPAAFTLRGWRSTPRGLPVLHFIHGNSYSGLTYLPLLSALSDTFDLFIHDAQGHGDSDPGGDFVGWEVSADYAVAAWRECGQEHFNGAPSVFGVGHSFGGILTMLMAHQQPQLFNQLALLDPILFPPKMVGLMRVLSSLGLYHRLPLIKQAQRRRFSWASAADAQASLTNRGMFTGWQQDALQAYIEHAMKLTEQGSLELKCSPKREAEIFASYATTIWKILPHHPVPMKLLLGTATYPFVKQAAKRLQRINDRCELDWQPGGHCFMQQDSATTAHWLKQQLLG